MSWSLPHFAASRGYIPGLGGRCGSSSFGMTRCPWEGAIPHRSGLPKQLLSTSEPAEVVLQPGPQGGQARLKASEPARPRHDLGVDLTVDR